MYHLKEVSALQSLEGAKGTKSTSFEAKISLPSHKQTLICSSPFCSKARLLKGLAHVQPSQASQPLPFLHRLGQVIPSSILLLSDSACIPPALWYPTSSSPSESTVPFPIACLLYLRLTRISFPLESRWASASWFSLPGLQAFWRHSAHRAPCSTVHATVLGY